MTKEEKKIDLGNKLIGMMIETHKKMAEVGLTVGPIRCKLYFSLVNSVAKDELTIKQINYFTKLESGLQKTLK